MTACSYILFILQHIIRTSYRQKFTLKSHLLLVDLFWFYTNFRLRQLVFPSFFLHAYILYTNCSTFFGLFSCQRFYMTSKSHTKFSSAACQMFSKSPTIDRPQQSSTSSISAKQSLDFQIIIKRSGYCQIGLGSNRIYDLL